MRRFFMGMAIASLTAAAPMTAFGGDREIADAIITTLKQQQSAGSLKGFDINLSVENGKVIIDGAVANQGQLDAILRAASTTGGVTQVVNNVRVERGRVARADAPAESSVVPASANDDAPELLTLGGDTNVRPEDAKITSEALSRLGSSQKKGELRNFDLDVSTIDSEVWVRGQVSSQAQKDLVLGIVQRVPGVARVYDEVNVGQAVRPVSNTYTETSAMPVVGNGTPRPFAQSNLVNGSLNVAPSAGGQPPAGQPVGYHGGGYAGGAYGGGYGPAAPVPMQGGPSYGGGVPRYDQPNMPNYAWPSYAAYPNYSAVTYPKQYSASAWPYIGPFYPYPQVPLGWRKVALEWDDGLWYLDFTHK